MELGDDILEGSDDEQVGKKTSGEGKAKKEVSGFLSSDSPFCVLCFSLRFTRATLRI